MSPDTPINDALEIDRLCDAFEAMYQAGQLPRIEDFLEQIAASSREQLLEALLPLDLELCGQPLTERLPDFFSRFSAAVVLRVFSSLNSPFSDLTVDASNSRSWSSGAAYLSRGEVKGVSKDGSDSPSTVPDRDSHKLPSSKAGSSAANESSGSPAESPDRIGRYEILKPLGEGGFGCVYLARDSVLDREVALKVIGARFLNDPLHFNNLIREARTAAQLEGHPGLVAVRDVQFEGEYPYIVQEYIKGFPLDVWLTQQRPTLRRSIKLFSKMVDAIGYAHQRDFVHRDLKPSNILIDAQDQPHIVDFGLALNVSASHFKRGEVVGTPSHMAPEQVRGESHRIDGRTDIWSLGVILYKLLTGKPPFQGKQFTELQEKITKVDPRPPRQLVPDLPGELERICLRCLEKLSSNRYGSTGELLEDVNLWLEQNKGTAWHASETQFVYAKQIDSTQRNSAQVDDSQPLLSGSESRPLVAVVPKGLRCFDEHDADFFLELLPGPRDRHGLPESLRFWKQRLEANETEQAFSVGLLYGPSGCGKSSLVRAGLLPRLSSEIDVVFVEATQDSTEDRISRGLQTRYPGIPTETLAAQIAWLRDRKVTGRRKTVLVIDQLEQWLHGREIDAQQPLVQALRQCNGSKVQCLLMMRDDFWMAATRLMRELEIRLVEGDNSAAVDLFSLKHTRRVLNSFGIAFQALSGPEQRLTPEQRLFLDKAIEGLSEEGQVVCVRLTLFAEMMKQRPWTSETLKQVGGVSGIGVTFLEETFCSRNAPPEYRRHQLAARRLLQALLPQSNEDIKGHMRTSEELLQVSGYSSQPHEFQRLVEILNEELRLITPTDPGSQVANPDSVDKLPTLAQRYYQLTHDYLVPSLRNWLTRKQRETHKGRAEIKLTERATQWNARPENRFLPSLLEWIDIRARTAAGSWSLSERTMMIRAGRLHLTRCGVATSVVLITIFLFMHALEKLNRQAVRQRVAAAVNALSTASGSSVPQAIQMLEALPSDSVIEELKDKYSSAEEPEKLCLAYGLAHFERVDLDELVNHAILQKKAPGSEVMNLVIALSHDQQLALTRINRIAETTNATEDWVAKTRLAIAAMHLGDPSLATEMLQAFPAGPAFELNSPDLRSQFRKQLNDLQALPKAKRSSATNCLARATANFFLDKPAQALLDLNALAAVETASADILLLHSMASARAGAKEQAAEAVKRHNRATSSASDAVFVEIVVQGWLGNVQEAEKSWQAYRRNEGKYHRGGLYNSARIAAQLAKINKESRPSDSQRLNQAAIQLLRFAHLSDDESPPRPDQDPFLIPLHNEPEFVTIMAEFYLPAQIWDPIQRTRFIAEFPNWHGNLESLVDIAKGVAEPSFSSGISLAAGGISEPSPAARRAWGGLMQTWYTGAADNGTHGATLWCLDRWNLPIPEIIPNESPSAGKNWWRSSSGLSMVRIPKGIVSTGDHVVNVHQEFWLCDQEIPMTLVRQFFRDTSYQGTRPQPGSIAAGSGDRDVLNSNGVAVNCSWYTAVMFCNWLSEREGRTPCYQIVPQEKSEHYDVSFLADGNGYYLPTKTQWEYACRAMTTTEFSFGDNVPDLKDYGIFLGNSDSIVASAGTRRCNAWGLFDMHGNVDEWCWDKWPNGTRLERVKMGGSFAQIPSSCGSSGRQNGANAATVRSGSTGFRIGLNSTPGSSD